MQTRLRSSKAPPNTVFVNFLLAVAMIFMLVGPALGSANTAYHDVGPAVNLAAGPANVLGVAPMLASLALRSIWSSTNTVVGAGWQHATNTLNAYPDIGRNATLLFTLLIALIAYDVGRRTNKWMKGGSLALGSLIGFMLINLDVGRAELYALAVATGLSLLIFTLSRRISEVIGSFGSWTCRMANNFRLVAGAFVQSTFGQINPIGMTS